MRSVMMRLQCCSQISALRNDEAPIAVAPRFQRSVMMRLQLLLPTDFSAP